MNCQTVDELAGAYALSAVPADEDRAISEHLASCDRPHDDARSLVAAAALVPAGLDPVQPSAALRSRLMTTIAAEPQEHRRPVAIEAPRSIADHRPWWRVAPLPSALAAVGLAAAIGLGGWGLSLNQQLAERDAALRAVASADAAHAVAGAAGSGWVLETEGQAIFLADSLAALPADQLYELWLIGDDGPVAVGTLTDTDGVALVQLERSLDDAAVFAVTVEAERVDAPTSDPVLVASLEG